MGMHLNPLLTLVNACFRVVEIVHSFWRQWLFKQRKTRSQCVPVPLIEPMGVSICNAHLELYLHNVQRTHFILELEQQRSARPRGPKFGGYKQLVNFCHHASVFQAEHVHGDKIARDGARAFRYPASAALGKR